MATLRNEKKIVAVIRDKQEANPRNNLSRDTNAPRLTEEYITQVSEEMEDKVTRKMFLGFSWTESRILGKLWKLDEFCLNSQIRVHCRTVPDISGDSDKENQESNEDRSQNDLHPEVDATVNRFLRTVISFPGDVLHNYLLTGWRISSQMKSLNWSRKAI